MAPRQRCTSTGVELGEASALPEILVYVTKVLNAQQFLPGMESSDSPRETAHHASATSGQWSGQIPGQLVMGVHEGEHGNPKSHSTLASDEPFEIDKHGFVYEDTHRPGIGRMTPSADKAAGNPSARDLYRQYGGSRDADPEVRAHWDSQPLQEIHTATPVHTSQSYETTEHKQTDTKPPGRERINKIRASLQGGEPIREPAWILKQSDRLYSMDGHHRMVAAREEGLSSYPARVWDRDAERRRG